MCDAIQALPQILILDRASGRYLSERHSRFSLVLLGGIGICRKGQSLRFDILEQFDDPARTGSLHGHAWLIRCHGLKQCFHLGDHGAAFARNTIRGRCIH